MHHRFATSEDCEILGDLNSQLIQDEGHRNSMSLRELTQRMRAWLATGYQASIFEDDSGVLAYALYREEADHVWLRQFFVSRSQRRRGIGRRCIRTLRAEVWPQGKRITVEVLCPNSAALDFWRATGFTDYSLCLEMHPNPKAIL